MTVASAREMDGRPFLRDHELVGKMGDHIQGPVHVIACHKGVTENQAVGLLGFPDATIVTPALRSRGILTLSIAYRFSHHTVQC